MSDGFPLDLLLREFRVRKDRHQEVVEVVGDATCQRVEPLELLRFLILATRLVPATRYSRKYIPHIVII